MAPSTEDDIPTFRVDLARPPELRYVDIAASYGPRIQSLAHVFDEILEAMLPYKWLVAIAKFAAKTLFRRVYDDEQTKEIRGFAQSSGVDLYLIIALNVFLDAMMGCTTGCVRVNTNSLNGESKSRLMHFRTLDWGLDALRELVIIVEYVDSSKDPDHVIATSITYAGFVGMLTGLRENLSISLNYRPIHWCSNSALKKHQLLVVLGYRPSISSIIRSAVFSTEQQDIVDQAQKLALLPSSPCYLTLCDGEQGVVIEKDLFSGRIKSANQFIVQTNHDSDHSSCCENSKQGTDGSGAPHNELWLQDSTDRMGVIQRKWTEHATQAGHDNEADLSEVKRNGDCISRQLVKNADDIDLGALSEATLREWMKDEAISNNFTHFACILDAATGKIRWIARGPAPQVVAPVEESKSV